MCVRVGLLVSGGGEVDYYLRKHAILIFIFIFSYLVVIVILRFCMCRLESVDIVTSMQLLSACVRALSIRAIVMTDCCVRRPAILISIFSLFSPIYFVFCCLHLTDFSETVTFFNQYIFF